MEKKEEKKFGHHKTFVLAFVYHSVCPVYPSQRTLNTYIYVQFSTLPAVPIPFVYYLLYNIFFRHRICAIYCEGPVIGLPHDVCDSTLNNNVYVYNI